jgi:hypothetical protein
MEISKWTRALVIEVTPGQLGIIEKFRKLRNVDSSGKLHPRGILRERWRSVVYVLTHGELH